MERVPQFCGICGSRLVSVDVTQGYDPYTGDPLSDTTLHCPNPTTKVSGRFIPTTESIYHPNWVYENSQWVQS